MYKFLLTVCVFAANIGTASTSRADLILSIGDIDLQPNLANQTVSVFARFSSSVAAPIPTVGGLQLNVRLGSGTGTPGTAPVFQGAAAGTSLGGISFDGTLWDGSAVDISRDPLTGFAQYASAGISFVSNSDLRTLGSADQLVAKLIIDTSGVNSGTFVVDLNDGDLGPSYFQSIADERLTSSTFASNGLIRIVAVPEPCSLVLTVLSAICLSLSRRRVR